MVGSRFNNQGDLHMRMVLGAATNGSLHLTARILKVYIKTLMQFSHGPSADVQMES